MIYRHIRRIILVLILVIIGNSPFAFSGQQQVNFCQLFGSVYLEKDPKLADFRVFEDDSEAFCDIVVYEVDSRVYADQEGLWHFTETKAFADFSISFEPDKGLADFSIFFTETQSFAGCNN